MGTSTLHVGLVIVAVVGYTWYPWDEVWTSVSQHVSRPIVRTKQGSLKGIASVSRGGKRFYEFLGIPYAKPPIGDLRFEPPQPSEPWQGVRDAGKYGPECAQMEMLIGMILGSEDCLFANVFTPKLRPRPDGKLLPVMMYIHGGLYINGGSDLWRPTYFMDEDVVLVTINYRLAALGFLSTGDEFIRGNMALKDQSMALRWVHENIAKFGGDPNSVTIFGQSAGATCAHFHMFSPMSQGLFHKVISQSGMAFSFWAMGQDPAKQAQRFASLLGCPSNSSKEMMSCMKKLDVKQIVEVHRESIDQLRDHITMFKPNVESVHDENTFLPYHPLDLATSGQFNKVPWITGTNAHEGLVTAAAIVANATLLQLAQDDFPNFVNKVLVFQKNETVAEHIRKFYFQGSKQIGSFDYMHSYAKMVTDRGFHLDIAKKIRLQAKHSPVYLYVYNHTGDWTVANLFLGMKGNLPRILEAFWTVASHWVMTNIFGMRPPNFGVSHGDELALLFDMPKFSHVAEKSRDYDMSMNLVKLWTDFAKDKKLQLQKVEWKPINNATLSSPLQFLKIDSTPRILKDPFKKSVEFWNSLLVIDAN